MNHLVGRLVTAGVRLVLPSATAHACTDTFFEYRCVTCGCSKCRQRRSCKICPSGKVCSSWVTIPGCCGGTCC